MSNPTLYEITPIMREVLDGGGRVKLSPRGVSMLPFIREERDEVTLTKPSAPYRKGDVFLYEREDGNLVLHRLVGRNKNGLIFRGDNQLHKEFAVAPQTLIGLVSSVHRKGREVERDSLLFYWFRALALPCCLFTKILRKIKRVFLRIYTKIS